MLGPHCINTWSKTQAIVSNSSAKSELYAAVTAACETLGFMTLVKVTGKELHGRLLPDASAAIGTIERRGSANVRHAETGILRLHEAEARRKLPLEKANGTDNLADLTTTNVDVVNINKYMVFRNLCFGTGRPAAAAMAHSADRSTDGDTWASRGHGGVWVIRHRPWRSELSTPVKINKGPGSSVRLLSKRVSRGVNAQGQKFELVDDWRDPKQAHKTMDDT